MSSLKFQIMFAKSIVKTVQFSKVLRQFSVTSNRKTTQERKINVDGFDINYLKVGTGKTPLLLLPGIMGTIWADFKPQIENLSRQEFTIVAWDPPGFGKSRPPNRNYTTDVLISDATYAYGLMRNLGFSKFSVLAWSSGGVSALNLTANHPEAVEKLILIGTMSFVLQHEYEIWKSLGDVNNWSENMRAPLVEIYGYDYLEKTCATYMDSFIDFCKKKKGDIYKDTYPKIKCPTLIVQGRKDLVVAIHHATFLKNNIANSTLEYFDEGGHNLHLRFPERFNKLVAEFLTEGPLSSNANKL